jgi:hypothetical protein
MRARKVKHYIMQGITALLALSCVEEIELQDELKFEDAIVIEATLTNEMKKHRILISRTYEFGEDGPQPETQATVRVETGGQTYRFIEEEQPGVYLSESPFKAEAGVDYQLFVQTQDGRSYTTEETRLTQPSQIDNAYPQRQVNSIGNEVLSIFVESYDPTRQSNYYRYEYEETYKIIAPNWVTEEFIILEDEYGNELAEPGFVPRPIEERVCYNTVASNEIIQTATTDLDEDRVTGFSVRNIRVDDPILSHRYSILIRQYVQSLEAYTYYDLLNQLSGEGNVLAQIQPGFINSNIVSATNRNEKVLGFFEVASVTEKRIFFNYEDLFPGEDLPPYFINCRTSAPLIATISGTPLKDGIQAGIIEYYQDNVEAGPNEGPYLVVPTACGVCTELGQSEAPDFWED